MTHTIFEHAPIVSDPEIMSGIPCFAGTRVPVKSLFDYLETGEGLESFLDDFPTVMREQTLEVLRLSEELVLASRELVLSAHEAA
jgi:uncharacterized protein (DUF433 family)